MVAEVSHDVIAAAVAGAALIIVATIPLLWKRLGTTTADCAELQRQLLEIRLMLQQHQKEE